jgi:hypothetical protein
VDIGIFPAGLGRSEQFPISGHYAKQVYREMVNTGGLGIGER